VFKITVAGKISHEISLPIENVVLPLVTADNWPKFALVVVLVVVVVAVVSK